MPNLANTQFIQNAQNAQGGGPAPPGPTAPTPPPQPAPAPPPGPTQTQTSAPGLPPTGLQQQLQSMREQYERFRTLTVRGTGGQYGQSSANVGVDVYAGANLDQGPLGGGGPRPPMGQTSLQQLANRLAQSYGLSMGRDQLFDAQGNANFTPDQISESSGGGETMGTAAAKMNYISAAIQRQQQQDMFKRSEASLEAGLGLTSKRARGSMVEQQQQFYAGLSDLYQNQQFEAMDFSYYIQREHDLLVEQINRNIDKRIKKNAQTGFWTGVAITAVGLVTGNAALIGQGGTMAGTSAEGTGYF